jgi:putative SOS response-associated peptidase YedK
MCGRYAIEGPGTQVFRESVAWAKDQQRLATQRQRMAEAERLGLTGYDIRPTQRCMVILPGGTLAVARWGWAREFASGGRIINARSETAGLKPTFSEAMRRRRCIVPASAYYEWRRDERDRPLAKYAFRPTDGLLFAMAGLFEQVDTPDGPELRMLVLTRPTVEHQAIHDRTPVMLSDEGERAWLDVGQPAPAAQALDDHALRPFPVVSGPTKARPAGPHLLEPIGQA